MNKKERELIFKELKKYAKTKEIRSYDFLEGIISAIGKDKADSLMSACVHRVEKHPTEYALEDIKRTGWFAYPINSNGVLRYIKVSSITSFSNYYRDDNCYVQIKFEGEELELKANTAGVVALKLYFLRDVLGNMRTNVHGKPSEDLSIYEFWDERTINL